MQPKSNLTLVARLDLVRRAIANRKSNRQIAKEIGCDEKSVRRARKILELPTDALEMIRNGGALNGVRILAPRTVELMTTNQVGTLHSTNGLGFEATDRDDE